MSATSVAVSIGPSSLTAIEAIRSVAFPSDTGADRPRQVTSGAVRLRAVRNVCAGCPRAKPYFGPVRGGTPGCGAVRGRTMEREPAA